MKSALLWFGGRSRALQAAITVSLLLALTLSSTLTESASAAASDKLIVVSLSEQHLYAYEGDTLVLSTPVTTGRPDMPTPIGTYPIQTKESPHLFVSLYPPGTPYYYSPISSQYALYFSPPGYYIHDSSWRPSYGPGTNNWHIDAWGRRRTGSLGCINVPGDEMKALYDWTPIGATLMVEP